MTDHHHPDARNSEAPTHKQLRCLRALANATGQTFTNPRTKAEASDEIDRLKLRIFTSDRCSTLRDHSQGKRTRGRS